MQRRPLNISAALAIAIERQVEDLIADAKRQCALQRPTDGEADRRREFLDVLRSGSEAPGLKIRSANLIPDNFWAFGSGCNRCSRRGRRAADRGYRGERSGGRRLSIFRGCRRSALSRRVRGNA